MMTKLMRTVVVEGPRQARVMKVPVPTPGPGQVLVKVSAVTTCPQWDMHIYYGKPMFGDSISYPYPAGQPGHEMTGIVVETGRDANRLRPGQAVCAWRDPGHSNAGCYAEYVLMDEANLIEVPSHLAPAAVVSLELAMCVASLILRLNAFTPIKDKKCGVNGLGPAGLIAVQMLRAEGASSVIGIDPHPDRRSLSLTLGATEAYEPGCNELPDRMHRDAIQLAVDCVGYPQAVHALMSHTREALGLFAVQREPYTLDQRGLSIIGYPGHYREAAEYALKLIAENQLDLRSLISKELPLESYEEGVELLKKQEAIKICFVPTM
ncbi:alcohol dehydrogenase catalytic domain-containing protein [Paenibacillus sp. J5C_2022]|uniref:zinc-dependent alcohol dehydrogenase n=1 Tax=Paenibacillus sp. J5C2022 TaxID=2977129 RepID=UPI0021D03FEE|nr:alcohol dehydrogenase catalytic domain-containing protein [Paenibacillus sp. J5C2022]MCU6709926.1 alcohol dehydrogenase catalytic domain-containing protein [Paenibacillus sp. J5C2022]